MHIQRVAIIGKDQRFSREAEEILWDQFNVSKYFSFSRFMKYTRYNRPDVIVLDADQSVDQIEKMIQSVRNAIGDVPVILHTTSQELAKSIEKIQKDLKAFVLTDKDSIGNLGRLAQKIGGEVRFQHPSKSGNWMVRFTNRLLGKV